LYYNTVYSIPAVGAPSHGPQKSAHRAITPDGKLFAALTSTTV